QPATPETAPSPRSLPRNHPPASECSSPWRPPAAHILVRQRLPSSPSIWISSAKEPFNDELVERVRLPAELAASPYLQEFYGTVWWSARAIYTAYAGWFDGNATNLFPL